MKFSKLFLEKCKNIIDNIDTEEIEKSVELLYNLRERKGRLFVIGSGGGAGHASHATNDFRKICGIEAYAPYDNISELTARINDEGWNTTIVNWLKVSNFNYNDAIFVFSVGGGNNEFFVSMNIVNAIKYSKEIGAKITGIVGRDGGITKELGNSIVLIPEDSEYVTPLTEGFQSIVWHLMVSHPKLKKNYTKW